MDIPEGMESLVFSWAYYKVKDFDKIAFFFQALEKKELFTIEKINSKKQIFKGAFVRPYPKGHWSPFANTPGAMQVMGRAELKNKMLVIETKTKTSLEGIKDMLEESLGNAIEFERNEYNDWKDLIKK